MRTFRLKSKRCTLLVFAAALGCTSEGLHQAPTLSLHSMLVSSVL